METAKGGVSMGRKPTKPNAIPRLRTRERRGLIFYYYDHGGKPRREEALGRDYGLAVKRWAELEREAPEHAQVVITFRYVANKYRAEVMPTKAPATQRDNARELAKLLEFFDDPPGPLDAIEPMHVRQYLNWRSSAKVRANREKALLSHLWNFARDKGYTAKSNPCAGIKGNRESGRDIYVADADYRAVWDAARAPLRDAMDLAYLTGQRPSDVLRMDDRDIKDGALEVAQAKTGAKLRIATTGELGALIERIRDRKRGMRVYATRLIVSESGQSLTAVALRALFDAARIAAGVSFQFRDLRAKAATDKSDASDPRQAQAQLGHTSVVMTEAYIRNRRGAKVTPTR